MSVSRLNTSGNPPDDPPPLPRRSNATGGYAIRPPIQPGGLSGGGANSTGGSSGLVGVRIRLNEPVFSETARLFQSVFGYQVQSVQIGTFQQCFPEGCFVLHNFRISGFQKPRAITLRPMQPNKLLLNIFAFDVDILGSINGNLQVLLNVPVAGQIIANARQISVVATFDLQKDQHRIPYLRTESCSLRSGYVNAQLLGMGIITDSKEMVDKAREILSNTICMNIERTIRDQVNERFKDLPKHISLYELFNYLDHTAADVEPRPIVARDPQSMRQYRTQEPVAALQTIFRQKRRVGAGGVASVVEIVTDEIQDRSRTSLRSSKAARAASKFRQQSEDKNGPNGVLDEIGEGGGSERLEPLNTANESTDRSPTTKRVGSRPSLNGDGWKNFSMKAIVPASSTYAKAPMDIAGLKAFLDTVDMNSLARLFVNLDFLDSVSDDDSFTVGMDGTVLLNASPYTGTYGDPPDDGDAAKLQFPAHVNHRSLEVIISEFTPNSLFQQAHRAKLLRFHIKNNTTLFGKMLKTTCTPDEHQIGKIPFSTIVRVGVRTIDQVLHVNLTIPQLQILDDLDFFELPPETLGGFRDALLVDGLDLNVLGKRLGKYGINDINLQLFAEGLLLMQADVDVYKLIFDDESLDRGLVAAAGG
ncbi:hypothetical protein M3Y99_01457900 [Aphelenchoides fujianensis]|nr:hypothetical protein M3Y99_01457900 [Aphelenchoides fujianensis]